MKAYSGELDLREERWNTVTHVLGIVFGIISIPLLIVNACDKTGMVITGASVYGASFLMMFVSSSLFHHQKEGRRRNLFKKMDHICIYYLIAGTYTPFILIFVNNSFGWMLLAVLWGLTAIGTIFKTFFTGKFELVSTLIYIAMGWMLLSGGKQFFENMPYEIAVLVVGGGILYSIGVLFYLFRWFTLHHAVWHLFVLAAAICHFTAINMAVLCKV